MTTKREQPADVSSGAHTPKAQLRLLRNLAAGLPYTNGLTPAQWPFAVRAKIALHRKGLISDDGASLTDAGRAAIARAIGKQP